MRYRSRDTNTYEHARTRSGKSVQTTIQGSGIYIAHVTSLPLNNSRCYRRASSSSSCSSCSSSSSSSCSSCSSCSCSSSSSSALRPPAAAAPAPPRASTPPNTWHCAPHRRTFNKRALGTRPYLKQSEPFEGTFPCVAFGCCSNNRWHLCCASCFFF